MDEKRLVVALFVLLVAVVVGSLAYRFIAPLTVSVFLYRAFHAELGKGPGFRTDRLLLMTFDPGLVRYDESQTRMFYDRLKDAVLATPGVTSAGFIAKMRAAVSRWMSLSSRNASRSASSPERCASTRSSIWL